MLGAEFATALEAIGCICRCEIRWRPHRVHRPNDTPSPEPTVSNAALLGRVVVIPHSDMAWLQPRRYCWVPTAVKVTSSYASPREEGVTNVAVVDHGSPTCSGAIYGTVPEAEIIGVATFLLHTSPFGLAVHLVDVSIVGVHLRRGPGSIVPRDQGTKLPLHQAARPKLGSGRAALCAAHGWSAPSLGGTAEFALGGRPPSGAQFCCCSREGPACTPHVAQGARNPLGA